MSISALENQKKAEKIYAFNIDFKKIDNTKKIGASYNNIGFYDELLNCDKILRSNKHNLSVTKSNGIKELVYCNKSIPEVWTTKVSYRQELSDIIAADKNFLNYLGRGVGEKKEENGGKKFGDKGKKGSFLGGNKGRHKVSVRLKIDVDEGEKGGKEEKEEKEDMMEEEKRRYNPRLSTMLSFNENYERQIVNLLDEYRLKYPLSLPKLTNKNKNDFNATKSSKLEGNLHTESSENHKDMADSYAKLVNLKKKLKPITKSEVLRGTIYTGLIPKSSFTPLNTSSNKKTAPNRTITKSSNVFHDIFLNSNSDVFNKETKITYPEIRKKLKEIKYYGPHFSHCPLCRNRNMEFYQTMETNTCLKLLNYLKKTRAKAEGSKLDFSKLIAY